MKKVISLLLLAAMLVLALAACGKETKDDPAKTTATAVVTQGDNTGSSTTAKPTTATTVPPTTPDPFIAIGEEVRALSDADRTFRIELSEYTNAEKVSKNKDYVQGPDAIEHGKTPALQQMVYERNRAANELLGTNISYVYYDLGWGNQTKQIKEVVQGEAADAPDLFVNMIYDLGNAILFKSFKDTWSIPGSYFDFDADGWMTEWMESMSLTHDRSYMLAGDYFLDVLRGMSVLPFNVDLMDENTEKLSPYILDDGESLEAGEKLSAKFFDLVERGDFTWAKLGQLCEAIWVDGEDSAQADIDSIDDVLGIVGDISAKMSSAIYLYSCGEEGIFNEFIVEDETNPTYGAYVGKTWISFPEDSTALGAIFDAVSSVYKGKGSLGTTGGVGGDTPDKPGTAYHRIKFKEGSLLFCGATVLGALEEENFQTMEKLYSVVPLPKLSVDKEYNTFIHNIADAGAINVNSTKAVAISAFVQYCTVNSGEIREEFLDVVTKYKTTRYNQGTDRMLTLIYDSVISGRDKMIEDAMSSSGSSGNDRWHAILDSGKYTTDSSGLAEKYQSAVSNKQSHLDRILTTWYTLPKVEPAAE